MHIASITPDRHAEFLALVDAEIRPDREKTHATLIGGLACLIREMATSCGNVPVAGIGSVVTRPENRGQGLSTALQNALLERLRGKNIPLAVLWTDQPEIYAGRGFAAAGWEMHLDLGDAKLADAFPPGFGVREFQRADTGAVQRLYDHHLLRTLRHAGDAERLYTMPGTRGLVATGQDDAVVAAVFCGKGADFPDYVAEWSGPVGLVVALLGEVCRRVWARHLLAPPGSEQLVAQLRRMGATVRVHPGGFWAVLQPEKLSRYLQAAGVGAPHDNTDPAAFLGRVDALGQPAPGPLTIGVWGLDSV